MSCKLYASLSYKVGAHLKNQRWGREAGGEGKRKRKGKKGKREREGNQLVMSFWWLRVDTGNYCTRAPSSVPSALWGFFLVP